MQLKGQYEARSKLNIYTKPAIMISDVSDKIPSHLLISKINDWNIANQQYRRLIIEDLLVERKRISEKNSSLKLLRN